MNILFLADLHIKLGQKDVPESWYINRFNLFIHQFIEMQEKADLVILGGDIFDRRPTIEELNLYFQLICSISKSCIIYDGNHEAITKTNTFLSYLKEATNKVNPLVKVVDDFYYFNDEDILIVPYCRLRSNYPKTGGKILCTHVRGNIPPHVKSEVDLNLFKDWKVVLAGDLHSYSNCQENILYPGSPYTTSFHRGIVDTGAILLNTNTLKHSWLKFSLPQLIRETVNAGEPTPETDYHHTIYDVTGNVSDLAKVKNNTNIKKKIKVNRDVALILESMTLDQEVVEYLTYIQNADKDTIDRALDILHKEINQ